MRITASEYIAANLIGGFIILNDEEENKLKFLAEQLNDSYYQLIYEYKIYLIDCMIEEIFGKIPKVSLKNISNIYVGNVFMAGVDVSYDEGIKAEDFINGKLPKKTPINDWHKEQRKNRNNYFNKQSNKTHKHGNYRGKANPSNSHKRKRI